jgi:PAS domain S-box-containing protein
VRGRDGGVPTQHTSAEGAQSTRRLIATIHATDLTAAVRASQAVSGEIVLENVIETLLVLALQQAGAERGLLILSRADGLRIEAEATLAASHVTVHRRQDRATTSDLPESILRYVARTQQSVILDDAGAENPFVSDPYVQQRQARSILCLPLVKQAALVGVLYLENNLTPGVFTPGRIGSLTLLASQAALSLENARLYSELQQAERNVRDILDLVPHHIAVAVANGTLAYANRPLLDYYGLTNEDLRTSKTEGLIRRFTHPDDIEQFVAAWERGSAGTAPWETEVRFRRRDGQHRWLLVRGTPLRDDGARTVGWYITGTDIDDRKRAEEMLARKEKELRDLVDSVPQQIVTLDPNGRRLYANRASLDYYGCTVEEFRAPDFLRTVLHPDDIDELQRDRQQLARGEPFDIETRTRARDGSYRWFLVRYRPFRDEDGRIARWYVTTVDIEDRRRTEERLQTENLALRDEIERMSMFEEIVGTSPALRAVLANVARVAPTDSTVLITGETGTGKELVARAIHKRSNRSSRAFVSVNCAAIPPALIASELFGHEKGAYTGALTRRLGRFELADGGTIFLDEIGDLPADTQLALLRVLQEREFERLGSTHPIKVDVRVIAATNRDLKAAMASGAFREDLFYRLSVFPIEMPPLRERTTDIPLLVAYFVERYASKAGKTIRHVDKRTLDLIQSYRWPGNVRELQNVIERAVIVCETDTLAVDENWLSREIPATDSPILPLGDALVAREREMIEAALAQAKGKVSGRFGAATILGIPPSTLESKIRTLKIRKHQYKGS